MGTVREICGCAMQLHVSACVRAGPASIYVPVKVEDLQLDAIARITMRPLVDKLPCIGAIQIALTDVPFADLTLKLINNWDLLSLPFIHDAVMMGVKVGTEPVLFLFLLLFPQSVHQQNKRSCSVLSTAKMLLCPDGCMGCGLRGPFGTCKLSAYNPLWHVWKFLVSEVEIWTVGHRSTSGYLSSGCSVCICFQYNVVGGFVSWDLHEIRIRFCPLRCC